MQQALGLLRRELAHGDARPLPHDVGDILGRHRDMTALLLLPALLLRRERLAQLFLLIAESRGPLEILRGDGRLFIRIQLLQFLLQAAHILRLLHLLHAHLGGRFIHEVNGLIRQEAIRDIAFGQLHGRLHGLVRNLRAVELLVARAQATQNPDGVLLCRLLHHDGLEPAGKRRILLKAFLVLIERRRADDLDLAARQRRLQDVGRIERALRGPGPDERMHLIDEEDDVARLPDLLDNPLQALLELAAVLGTRHERGHGEGVYLLALQHIGHGALVDALGQPLGDGRLADARLTDEDRVVLRAARENLDHALDFLGTADHWVETAFGRHLREITAVLLEQWRTLDLLAATAAAVLLLAAVRVLAQLVQHNVLQRLDVDAEILQHIDGVALGLLEQAQQDVLCAHVVVAHLLRFLHRPLHHALGPRRVIGIVRGIVRFARGIVLHACGHFLEVQPRLFQHVGGHAAALMDEAEQNVGCADIVLLQTRSGILRKLYGLDGPVGEMILVVHSLPLGRAALLQHGPHTLRPQAVDFILGQVLIGRQILQVAAAAADEDLRETLRRDLTDDTQVDAEAHLREQRQRLFLRQGTRIAQYTVGAPYIVLQRILHVDGERLARLPLVRDDLLHGRLQVAEQFLLAESQRELVGDLVETADTLLVIAEIRPHREAELRRDVHDAADVARRHEPWQMQDHACAQARAEVRRAGGQIAHLFIEGDIELRLEPVVDLRGHGKGLLEVEPRRHALDAQVILLVDHEAHALVLADKGHAMLRLAQEIAADEVLLDEHFFLQRCQTLHIDAVKTTAQPLLQARQHLLDLRLHFAELADIRAVREGNLAEVTRETDAAREHDITVRAFRAEPRQRIASQ